MEEVIGGMSGHVPMRAIAESVMRQYSQDQWGDFKVSIKPPYPPTQPHHT